MTDAVSCMVTDVGQGPPLIMVHGIGARRSLWAAVTQQLKDRYRCISYDLRGHGDSLATTTPFTLDDLVNDLEALRKRLGLERVHIVGHSLGGMIGPAYARRFPERVISLGLFSTAAFRTVDDAHKVQGLVAAMRQAGVPSSLDVLVNRWFTDAFAHREPQAVELRKRQVLETDQDIFLTVFNIYATTEMSPWLGAIEVPALVLTGEQDGGCSPRLNRQIAAAMPNATLVVLDTLKHAILIEAPEQVARHLLAFLATVQRAGDTYGNGDSDYV